ncbi:hypothetical protein SEVIR_2G195650v4 [Setaria viridis]
MAGGWEQGATRGAGVISRHRMLNLPSCCYRGGERRNRVGSACTRSAGRGTNGAVCSHQCRQQVAEATKQRDGRIAVAPSRDVTRWNAPDHRAPRVPCQCRLLSVAARRRVRYD